MKILAQARAMRYEVGTNLKGRGVAATWTLLLPSIAVETAGVLGHATPADADAIDRLAGRVVPLEAGDDGEIDLVLVGRGGADLLGRPGAADALAHRLSPDGAIYGESRGGTDVLPGWPGPMRRLDVWPAFGPPRVFVPADDPRMADLLTAMGFLPPRGSAGAGRRVLNRLAVFGPVRHRLRREAAIGLPSAARFTGPPAYVVEAARAGGVEIGQARWALVAPGDYASQKVLLLLFDEVSGDPWTIVKLGADPAHAERLRNEAASLARLEELGLPDGTFPTLRFAGEHAGRGIVGQSWLAGRPFTSATVPEATSPFLAAAASWLTSLAARSVQRRSAADVGAAVADLFDRFRAIYTLPDDEMAFLDRQVSAIAAHIGELPVVFQHGDPGAWNLLAEDDGRVAFLDWESAEVHGMPLWDLFHFQASFGAWASQAAGVRRRLTASIRHLATASELQSTFARQIRELGDAVDMPRSMIRPLFYAAWMHRSLKEATRRTPATLERGLYLRMLRELVRRRDEPALQRLLDGDA